MTAPRHNLAAAFAAAGIALAALAAPALAHDRHDHGSYGFDLFHGVQLTDAQQAQVRNVMQAAETASAPARTQMHALREQIESRLLSSGSVGAADLAPLLAQEEQLRSGLDANRLDTALKLRAILTPTQLSAAAATHAQLAALHERERRVEQPATPTPTE